MADRMLTFPSRASAAPLTGSSAVADAPERRNAFTTPRERRPVLVKGANPRQHAAAAQQREWRTREIVAQVEREMAALARRTAAERLTQIDAEPPWMRADAPRRDTPWTVLLRVLRVVRAEDAGRR